MQTPKRSRTFAGWIQSLAVLITLVVASLYPIAAIAQWNQFGGVRGDFRIDDSELKGPGNAWSIPLGASDSQSIVDGDRFFLTSADFTDDGLDSTRVSCVERQTGKMIWSKVFPESSFITQDISDRYPVRPLATPCISANSLVVVGFGGTVHCLNKTDGSERWSHDLVKEFSAEPIQYGFATSPWSDGKQVLIASGGAATVLSFDLATGKELWRCGTGGASYCSFTQFQTVAGKPLIVYAAQNELLGIEPNTGRIAWQYSYPQKGLTNAVTPLAVDKGKLLVGGQGFSGTRLLEVVFKEDQSYEVQELWKSSRQQPFYCNWVQLQSAPNLVVGFSGKTLVVLDWTSGKIVSQSRGWTDCNIVTTPEGAIAVRGDGFLGKLTFPEGQPVLVAGCDQVHDRVWSATCIAKGNMIVRGRNSLVSIPLSELRADQALRDSYAITSMDAMYGGPVESIERLIGQASSATAAEFWQSYQAQLADVSTPLSNSNYTAIIKALTTRNETETETAMRVAADWSDRQPQSIPAFQSKMELLRKLGREAEAKRDEAARMVDVEFIVKLASSNTLTVPADGIFVTGNAAQLGNWDGKGLALTRVNDQQLSTQTWQVKTLLPRGDLQFKFTGGSFESVEVRSDGRSISNRRYRVGSKNVIQAEIAGFKKAK